MPLLHTATQHPELDRKGKEKKNSAGRFELSGEIPHLFIAIQSSALMTISFDRLVSDAWDEMDKIRMVSSNLSTLGGNSMDLVLSQACLLTVPVEVRIRTRDSENVAQSLCHFHCIHSALSCSVFFFLLLLKHLCFCHLAVKAFVIVLHKGHS